MRAEDARQPTLLVVDDQAVNIQVLHRAFCADHQVLMATSGAQALRMCRSHRIDLVLLDVAMPGMGGHEVCRQLKSDPATCDIPVVFVTAHDDPDMEAFGLELGAVDFIVKPIKPAVVRARVKTHLGLARASALVGATLECTAAGILATDVLGRVSHFNRPFLAMWDIDPELMGPCRDHPAVFDLMHARTLHPDSYRNALGAALARHDTTDGFDAVELPGDRHLEQQVHPFCINGKQVGHVLSFRDVTEHRRAAVQLRSLNETLESRILDRTLELEASVQRADAASQAKSQFLSNMSHEIRTPLNGVIGMVHLALKAESDERQRHRLQQIQGSGQHLLGIVNDILDFSRIEAGKLQLEETDFSLADLLVTLADQTNAAAREKGLELAFQADPGLAEFYRGDVLRIRQVLLNFIGNAIKFSTRGEVCVRAMGLPEHGLRFEVQDQGPGMTAQQLAGLFQSFHQADASMTRRYGGSGLGLAISRQLAALMGGEVGVRSEPGVGSLFWLDAPLSAVVPCAPPRAAAPDLDVLRGARILVAEDNPLNQRVAVDLLEDVGARVHVAADGAQAIDLMRLHAFDCVLMDMQMPVLDGLEATRWIRAAPRFCAIPVIAVTANASEDDRARCLAAGMVDFVSKPFDPAHLHATVARWLTKAPPPAEKESARGPAFDVTVLSHNSAGNPERMRRYAAIFNDDIAQALRDLQRALAQGDLPALADLAHRLKSSARMVGATRFATLCEALEALRVGGSIEQASAIVQVMPAMLAQVSAGIDKEFA